MRGNDILIARALLFLSGGAALGYQMVWTRMFATGLGHEAPAMLAIVCAFMAGNGLGSWAYGRWLAKSRYPLRCYSLLEFAIGLWALASTAVIPLANELALDWMGISPAPIIQWAISFLVPCVALLPCTVAMGATFPAMEQFVAVRSRQHHGIGGIYAAGAFGAVAGIFASTFAFAPHLGFRRTVMLLAGVNIACAIMALVRKVSSAQPGHDRPTPSVHPPRLLATLLVTGVLGIGFEVIGTRVLSQVLENTIYTFSTVLGVFLLGTGAGAAVYQRWGGTREPRAMLSTLLCLSGLLTLLSIFALRYATEIYHWAYHNRGGRLIGIVSAECVVALAVFAMPTAAMGALFSCLLQRVRDAGGSVGAAVGLNTLGGAIAPALFGVALLPLGGSKWTLVAAGLAYILLAPSASRKFGFAAGAAAIIIVSLPADLHVVTTPPGGKVVAFHEGVMAAVAVVKDAHGNRILRVNNRFQMGGTAAADAEYRTAHIPLLLHPAPHRALFLGLGTGITLGGALLHPDLTMDGVELVPEVLEVMPWFEPQNRDPRSHTNVHLYVADARRFVRVTTNRYDVIVADLFHPARDGAGTLYTVEHYRAMRDRLAPGGLACQWLPLHQLDSNMLAVIVRSFVAAFPSTQAYLLQLSVEIPVLGLVGFAGTPPRYTEQWMEQRVQAPALREELKRLAMADSLRLFGLFVETQRRSDAAPLNTDDDPLVTFNAPKFIYDENAAPYGRLLPLLGAEDPARITSDNAVFRASLASWFRARHVYLSGLVSDYEGRRDEAIAKYVESAALSPQFTAGYAQCLTIASVLFQSDPAKSRAILQSLIQAQPSRPVARQMLEKLSERQ